ncbi:hypothetical protein BCR43DRAFT_484381 [Syncephalastrum racemosum]|uniref:Uncharacterized protein n=1 Tax=Syncephalastrum racemosum TaxID=13706 RepID=A0A1X2HX24_SYNRA|nr:hypothetical protein BCR43DRAFT_484381 [Syncephalastrum racemosum]
MGSFRRTFLVLFAVLLFVDFFTMVAMGSLTKAEVSGDKIQGMNNERFWQGSRRLRRTSQWGSDR